MSKYDVDDLTNKIDVGSQPGTMWSLSSQKPGHGLAELRDPSSKKLWQSDGLLPHTINIQFARRTAVTHVSIYTDFREDDSYTPSKVRILAGTHFHDLVEVRTRELKEPAGWKHFILEKASLTNESDETDSDASSANSDDESDTSDVAIPTTLRQSTRSFKRDYIRVGVSKRHAPISVFLVQICILSNHAAGKDTHIRGIHIFGPPTRESRERAEREAMRNAGRTLATLNASSRQNAVKDEEERTRARQLLQDWLSSSEDGAANQARTTERNETRDVFDLSEQQTPLSRRTELLSMLR